MNKLYLSSNEVTIVKSDASISTFDRKNLKELDRPSNNPSGTEIPFISILGYFKEADCGIIVVVTEVEKVSDFVDAYLVKKYELVQLTANAPTNIFVKFLKLGLDTCKMFYSKTKDLSISYEHQYDKKPTRFYFQWNHFSMENLKSAWPGVQDLLQPVICGYVREIKPFVLISRRIIYNNGFHIWNRGADVHGHAANFVETEAIYYDEHTTISYVMLRGSCPLFWSQHPTGELSRPFRFGPESESIRRFNLHFDLLDEEYGKNMQLVILTELKGKEGNMTKLYTSLCKERGIKYHQISVNYYMFTKGVIRKLVLPFVEDVDWFQIQDGEVVHRQKSYIRTNCASSLDRTNMFQSILMERFFSKFVTVDENIHLELWVTHADTIALQYAGTLGQKKAMTLTGYQDEAGRKYDRINSRQRYIQSMTLEGTLSDSFTVVSQEKPIPRVSLPNAFNNFLLLVLLLFMSAVIYLQDGQKEAFMYWRKHIRNIINHPLYEDIRDADEYDESEFAQYQK